MEAPSKRALSFLFCLFLCFIFTGFADVETKQNSVPIGTGERFTQIDANKTSQLPNPKNQYQRGCEHTNRCRGPIRSGDRVDQKGEEVDRDDMTKEKKKTRKLLMYPSDFPSSIKEHSVFVDMAPRFHLMAEEILQIQIRLICFNLKEAIDGADGFQNTHQMQHYESAKFSIDQVAFILEKVHLIWKPLLLPSTYKESMCMDVESVFSRMVTDIHRLDDMAAKETLQLQRLIHLMLENLYSLLASLIDDNQEGSSPKGSTLSLDDLMYTSLCKIHQLADLLDMPLKSITSAWESGELVSCGFTLSEVEDFIKAIFTDSPLRKECLRRIKSASFFKRSMFH